MKKLFLGIGIGFIFIFCLGLSFSNRNIATDDVIMITESDEVTRHKMKWSDVEAFMEANIDAVTNDMTFSGETAFSDDVTADSTVVITTTFTDIGAVAYKPLYSNLAYTPADTGSACPIAVVGKITLNGGMTDNAASSNYNGYAWGLQGQIHSPTGATHALGTGNDPGGIYAGVRGVLTDAGTSTWTSGTVTAFYGESQISEDVTTGDFRHFLCWLRNQGSGTATNIDAALYIDEGNAWSNTIQTGVDINNSVKGIDVSATTTGIDFSSSMTQEIIGQNDETIDNATNGVWNLGASQLQVQTINFGSLTGGTADSLYIDFTPDLPALTAGLIVEFVADSANTGACTITVDGTEKNIYEASDISALDANDIRAGMFVSLRYDGTQWQQVSQSGN